MAGTRVLARVRGWDGSSLGMGTLDGADPLGFAAGDTNLYRYVGNTPTDEIDPAGLGIKERKNWENYQKDPAKAVKYPGDGGGQLPYRQLVAAALADKDVLDELCATLAEARRSKQEVGGFILWNSTTGDYEVTHSGTWPYDKNPIKSHAHWPKRRADGSPVDGSGYVPVIYFHTHPNDPDLSPGDKDKKVDVLNNIPYLIIFTPNGVCYTQKGVPVKKLN